MIHLEDYNYDLPENLIRKTPLEIRDSAKLLVYNTATDEIIHSTVREIASFVPAKTLLVRNVTRVLPVRLWLKKETGGKIEVFVLMNLYKGENLIPAIIDRKLSLLDKVYFEDGQYLTVEKQDEAIFYFSPSFDISELVERLYTYGHTPLPHYLEGGEITEENIRERYQTIFAHEGASVAAPTASLHFTDRVFDSLQSKNVHTADIVLNVGQGTFAPIGEEELRTKKLHTEYFEIHREEAKKILDAKARGDAILAIGTTTVRTLESVAKTLAEDGIISETSIFIYPPYEFQMVDMLMTNFHLPKTSLMLLVDAFLKHKKAHKTIQEIYQIAIAHNYSFYSFGDSMLII